MKNTTQKPLVCERCGYSWEPKTENPKMCPGCHSLKWREAHEAPVDLIALYGREPLRYPPSDLCWINAMVNAARMKKEGLPVRWYPVELAKLKKARAYYSGMALPTEEETGEADGN